MQASIEEKKKALAGILKPLERLAVALSGGVDSALLLVAAHDVLGDRLIAVTARSPIHPEQDLADATSLCNDLAVPHWIIDSAELTQADFVANTPQRCYVCKTIIFGQLWKQIKEMGVRHLAHGVNVDDLNDYRPGLRAARELGVIAPLAEAGLTKDEVRVMARERGLWVWNKPSMACIATRIPYGSPITRQAIEQVKEAETLLGHAGIVGGRVRHHGNIARIEVGLQQLPKLVDDQMREQLVVGLREIGFDYICVDLDGYVSGSMNRALLPKTKHK